jgi:hypothetical protein
MPAMIGKTRVTVCLIGAGDQREQRQPGADQAREQPLAIEEVVTPQVEVHPAAGGEIIGQVR